MNEQGRFIKILLLIIVILAIILLLKVTGVIKPKKKETINIEVTQIENVNSLNSKEDEELLNNSNYMINDMLSSNEKSKTEFDEKIQNLEKESAGIKFILVILMIVVIILVITYIVGEVRLYRKLEMPEWTIQATYCSIIISIFFGRIKLIAIILGLLGMFVESCYFQTVEMSKYWSFIRGVGVVLCVIGLLSTSIMLKMVVIISACICGCIYLIVYSVSNVKLARYFDKSMGFTVGIVILPFIFRPILGFQRD